MPLGHLGLNVSDLDRAKGYWDELMPMLSYAPVLADDRQFAYAPAGGKVGTWIFFYGGEPGYSRHHAGLQHLAFIVKTRSQVHEVYDWAMGKGGPSIREPQELPQYHEGYYAAYWLDPEGFLVEVVCHRDQASSEDAQETSDR